MTILEYFRLNEEPFRISPNPRFLFLNEQVKEASSKVSYMTKHRTAPLYMYGAIESGKTGILGRLSVCRGRRPPTSLLAGSASAVRSFSASWSSRGPRKVQLDLGR